jgi:hypothetical protein
LTYFTVVTTAWVDADADDVSGSVGGKGNEEATGTDVKGAETAGVDTPELESVLEPGGGLPPVVRGVVTGDVPAEEAGTVAATLPRVVTEAVPKFAGVEKFPLGILYVMLNDGIDAGTDEIDTAADGVGLEPDVDGELCGPVDGGPQSKPTL